MKYLPTGKVHHVRPAGTESSNATNIGTFGQQYKPSY